MACFQDFQDDLLTCPYNSVHKVAKRRFLIHIEKCKINYPDWTSCPFNNAHRMHRDDKEFHMISCPDAKRHIRDAIEKQQIEEKGHHRPANHLPVVANAGGTINSRDNWDTSTAEPFVLRGLKPITLQELLDDKERLLAPIDGHVLNKLTQSERSQYYMARMAAQKEKRNEEKNDN